jgi:hypothetical protein
MVTHHAMAVTVPGTVNKRKRFHDNQSPKNPRQNLVAGPPANDTQQRFGRVFSFS